MRKMLKPLLRLIVVLVDLMMTATLIVKLVTLLLMLMAMATLMAGELIIWHPAGVGDGNGAFHRAWNAQAGHGQCCCAEDKKQPAKALKIILFQFQLETCD